MTAKKIYTKGKHNHKRISKTISIYESKYPLLVNNPSWKYAKIVKSMVKKLLSFFLIDFII